MMTALLSTIPNETQAAALLIDAGVKGLAIALVALVVVLALRKQAAAWRHLVWSLTAAGLVVLPVLSMSLPAWQIPVPAEWLVALPEETPAPIPVEETAAESGALLSGGVHSSTTLSGESAVPDSPVLLAEKSSHESSEAPAPRPEAVSVSTVLPGESTTETALTPPELSTTPQSVAITAAKIPAALPDQKPKTDALKFLSLLTWCWLVGVAVAGLVPLIGLAQVFRLRRGATRIEDESWLALLDDVSRELRILRPVRLLKSPRTKMPLTWGVIRPVVLVPDEAESWSGSRRRMVLLHELAHVKRLDWLTQMVGQAACSLHWFNPLVWLAARRMQVEREQACDDMVLAAGTTASEYASELLHFASRLRTGSLSALAAVPMARQTSLEQRVRGILDGSRRRASVTRVAMMLGLAACCGVLVPLAMLQASAQDEPPGKLESVEEPEQEISEEDVKPDSDEGESQDAVVDSDDEPPVAKTAKKAKDQSKDKAVSLDPSQKWKLKGGVTAEVRSSVFHGADVMTNVILHWPAKGKRPALQYAIHVAADAFGNRESWSVVWERGTTRLWVASSGFGAKYPNLRTIDFRDPNRIYTWTHYGSKEFKTTEPEIPTVNARRQGVSIGETPPRVPEPVMEKLAVKMPLVRKLKKEGGHYSGNHIDAASVKAEWIVTGTVRDLQKRPMKGVLVEVYTEFHPTTRIAVTRTNSDGEYSLLFRMDLRTLNEWRGLTVAPRIAGFVDDDFGRSGELTMQLREGEKIKNRFSEKNAIVGEPVTANFLMQPAATVTGQILDSNGKPWADSYLGLKYEGQRRGYSVASSATDKDGNFRMTNVPTEKPLQLITSRPNRDETIVIGTVNAKRTNAVQHLRILKGNDSWKIDNLVFNVPARVRVVEGQDEIEPPKQIDSFVQKVIDWAESCRLNRSAEVLEFNPGVWSDVIAGHSLVHVVFAEPRQVRIVDADNDRDGPLPIDEIAFALPQLGPGGLFLKSGERVLCLNHWTIEGFRPVITEPALRATQHKWYARLIAATAGVETKTEKTAIVRIDAQGKVRFRKYHPIPFRTLTKELEAAGFDAKSTTVILKTDPAVRIKELHWPLWQLGNWKHVFIDFEKPGETSDTKSDDGPEDAPVPDPPPKKTGRTIRGIQLDDFPSTTDFESIQELREDDPDRPGKTRFSRRSVFSMPVYGEPDVWLRYAPLKRVFFLTTGRDATNSRTYGPIPGDPFEKMQLMKLLRETSRANRSLRISDLVRSPDEMLRSRGYQLIPDLPPKKFRSTYADLTKIVRESLQQESRNSKDVQDQGLGALHWLVTQESRWEARRAELPDSSYTQGEPSKEDRKIVWSEPNKAGLRLGHDPAPWRNAWFYGDQFELALWVDNISEEPIRFSSTPRADESATLYLTPEEGPEIPWNIVRFSLKIFGSHYELQPGHRIKVKTVRFTVEPKSGGPKTDTLSRGFTGWFKASPGKYRFRIETDLPGFERLGADDEVLVPAAGEWIGTLSSKPIDVTVSAPPTVTSETAEAEVDPKLPETTFMSGDRHSAFAVQTSDKVHFVLYSWDKIESEIKRTGTAADWSFRGPVHLVRNGKRIRSFEVTFTSKKPGELWLGKQRIQLTRVVAVTEKGAIQIAGRLIGLTEDLDPLNTQRTLELRNAKDLKTIRQMADRDLVLARHYRFHRELDTMTGWILAWNDQHMIQHSDGAYVPQMRIFPDGRVVVPDRRRGLLTLRLSRKDLNELLNELIEHPAAQRLPKRTPRLTETVKDESTIPFVQIRGGHWDQASSRVTIHAEGETYSLFYLSKSRDGRPQTGMSDEQWRPLAKRLWDLAMRVQKETAEEKADEG